MTATLRIVLDQAVAPTDDDLAMASVELARALIAGSPDACDVAAIAPAAAEAAGGLETRVPGLSDVRRTTLTRPQLAAAWQLGVAPGVGGGMIHSPTLLAPLVRHDRVHDHDQTVVTLWSLDAWLYADEVPRAHVAWQRAMLKRAVRFADAVVVPTHAMADQLVDIARLGGRVRVIPGAAPYGFAAPSDVSARARDLGLDGSPYVVVSGGPGASAALTEAFHAVALAGSGGLDVVVLGSGDAAEPTLVELASAAGLPARHVRVLADLDVADRAAVLDGSIAFVAPSASSNFPWRMLEALAVGTPVIAAATPTHAELLIDGGQLVAADGPEPLAGAIARLLADDVLRSRMSILASDRARAFSWRDAAERVWQLHAEL